MSTVIKTALPPIVSIPEWEAARAELLVKEKAHMRAGDALAAERRRLPMVEITTPYLLEGPEGTRSLLDLFDGRSQLIVYHFMYDPSWNEGCTGCSLIVDNMGHPAHLNARDTTRIVVSLAPLEKLQAFQKRMGWDIPWYSSNGTTFNQDFHATVDGEEHHRLSVFLRDGDRIFFTYQTGARGGEVLMNSYHYLDLTPLGRQEDWEDSPAGWPQTPTYDWQRLHDRYDTASDPKAETACDCGCSH
jgi:predicted dithiol-disulfide oxidoreductase (DUF899 family)